MEKIIDISFRRSLMDALMESGISEAESLKIVNKRYKEALLQATVERLELIIKLLKEGKYEVIENLCCFSPAGDDMGCNNTYINFMDVCGREDIGEVVDTLKEIEQ